VAVPGPFDQTEIEKREDVLVYTTPHSRRSDRNGGIKVVCIFQAITGKSTKLAYFKTMDVNGKNS
jgi:hypothetical protein